MAQRRVLVGQYDLGLSGVQLNESIEGRDPTFLPAILRYVFVGDIGVADLITLAFPIFCATS
jgi:hypothetical protein